MQRLRKLGPVCFAPTLDFGEPRQDFGTARCGEVFDHPALRIQTESACTLPGGGNRS
jgi:hypothetical protein